LVGRDEAMLTGSIPDEEGRLFNPMEGICDFKDFGQKDL
jgi:hypothetical protein